MRALRLLLSGLLVVGAAACGDVDVRVYAYGLSPKSVQVEVEELGAVSAGALRARVRRGEVDGAAVLGDESCGGPCRAVEVTLFIRNDGDEPLAPPVARLSSPEGRPARLPVAFRAEEISPGRTGRLRFVTSLWPGERSFDVRLSGSVFLDVTSGAPTRTGP